MSESNRGGRTGGSARTKAARRALRGGDAGHPVKLDFGRANYLLLALGLVAVVVGFALLAKREISVAPVLLVAGYCLLIPAGLLYRSHGAGDTPSRRARRPGANSSAG